MARSQLNNAQKLFQARRYAEAERACREALKAKPNDTQAMRLLAQAARHTGKAQESVRIFQQLRQARPSDVQLLGELGASLTLANHHAKALPLLQQAVSAMPKAARWQVWLGRCLLGLFHTNKAIHTLEAAHNLDPEDADAAFHLANALLNAARERHAEPYIRAFLVKQPESVAGRTMLAKVLEHQSRLDEAVDLLGDVLGPNPGDSADPATHQALGGLIRCLNAKGDTDAVMSLCQQAAARKPTANLAVAIAPVYLKQKQFQLARDLVEDILARERMPEPVKSGLLFNLGEALRGLKQHDDSFRAFIDANDCFPDSFNREHRQRLYGEIRRVFSADFLKAAPRSTLDTSTCVFIVGMPRSGTSLVEQILDAHPRVHGAGELNTLPNLIDTLARKMGTPPPTCFEHATQETLDHGAKIYLDHVHALAPDADLVIDKLPHNFEMLGLINVMLPGAKIIHCSRNPIDNCVSAFCTQLSAWHSYANNLDTLGWAYGQYTEIVDHWHAVCDAPILDVPYEDVVADTEAQARRIVEFVGMEWDDRCLRFYESDRAVTTASVDQVRQPIYATSVARWKRYEQHLAPLISSLRSSGVEIPDA